MMSPHTKTTAIALLSIVMLAQMSNWAHGNRTTKEEELLERVIREAEEESKQLANDINDWMNEESLKKELAHLRVRKSTGEGTDTKNAQMRKESGEDADFTAIRRKRDLPKGDELQRESGTVLKRAPASRAELGKKKGTSNPVLQAFDLMKLLIREREKSLKRSKVSKLNEKKITGSRSKDDSKYAKKRKFPKPQNKKNNLLRSRVKGSKKFKVSHRRNLAKVASHSNTKHLKKSGGKAHASHTRNVVQMLKAMPRKQLRDILKDKGLGKYWNVVRISKKDPTKRKPHGKDSKRTSSNTTKIAHGPITGKKHDVKATAARSDKKVNTHKKHLKTSWKQAPKSKTRKKSSDKPSIRRNDKKRAKIQRPTNKLNNFQKKNKGSKKTKKLLENHTVAALKEKIHRTNELKFRVAKALLAHCATQNKLRDIFRDVNMSLKKAAVLVEIIARKLGIEEGDVQKIIKQHPEKAVQQFLSEVF